MSELKATGIYLEGRYYGVVQDYPFTKVRERGPDALQKAVAYRYHREFLIGDQPVIQDYIFPYRGVIQKNESLLGKQPGIYFLRVKHDKYKEFLIRPRNVDEAIEYSPKKEADMVFAIISGDYVPNDFSDSQLNLADIGTDVYLPPIHVDDDPLNMILKLAIRLKGASFAPYGKRLEALALDRNSGTEGANMRNNVRRAMWLNKSLSPNKMCQYADCWQLDPAIVLRDHPDAMHRMHIPEGKMLVVYPNGLPFPIESENLLDITDMISDAILSSVAEDGKGKDKKK